MFYWISLIVFWGAAIKSWIYLGPKIPLIFIGLWLLGLLAYLFLSLNGYIFMVINGILAIILWFVAKYQSAL